ncbi:hypothetical protein BRYFOR_08562 [Marvinbryantia formatexigens DSM 14469]|uniref:Uncharacterized protein n=1 Tax=Marvinbryantia formatexigens DSM 14469 TaxID=478749 RepID=C6LIT2_9FIRM|nr:hypothetical protein [Marvinbryantia formatexigens]EET59471.1 hypothetical protein BRYFOR_08562 [Marvinbryantia formatexigens DSM 14469]UWO24051.1 hypothetical protein NQ534_16635 [Marvinbryantia formatexigens DSM 14469]SDG65278.1 hypothetical protein SAMN05660368_02995 [Marvinbryantia formatexigens]
MEKKWLNGLLIFAAGMLTGSAITLGFIKKQYAMSGGYGDSDSQNYDYKNLRAEAEDIVTECGYTGNVEKKEEGVSDMCNTDKPYVIKPEEACETGYDLETLTLYADGILEDSRGIVIGDPEGTVGEEYEYHFDEYEEGSVYVRNEAHEMDYEIIQVNENYADVKGCVTDDDES